MRLRMVVRPGFIYFFVLLFTTEVGHVGGRYPLPHNVNFPGKILCRKKRVEVPPLSFFRAGAASRH